MAKELEPVDPFAVLVVEEAPTDFSTLSQRPAAGLSGALAAAPAPAAATARFHGFDGEDRPLLASVPGAPNEIVPARTTVPLVRAQIGADVVVLFEQGNPRQPIVIGVVQGSGPRLAGASEAAPLVSVDVDDDRIELKAERQIVLRCGEASITLTRAGKVIIKGTYVLSRSSGYNKIKGAAIDIN
jgi:hypothetical protein